MRTWFRTAHSHSSSRADLRQTPSPNRNCLMLQCEHDAFYDQPMPLSVYLSCLPLQACDLGLDLYGMPLYYSLNRNVGSCSEYDRSNTDHVELFAQLVLPLSPWTSRHITTPNATAFTPTHVSMPKPVSQSGICILRSVHLEPCLVHVLPPAAQQPPRPFRE